MARANAIFNQLYVVSPERGGAGGARAQRDRRPGGHRAPRAPGAREELLTEVLDLDAVKRVRRFGTAGVSRMWEQLVRAGPDIELPMYGGTVQPPPR